jgi:phosphate transport system substrate-binding protein
MGACCAAGHPSGSFATAVKCTPLTRTFVSRRGFLTGLAAATLAGCSRVETPRVTEAPVRIRLGADGAVQPLLVQLARAYQREHPAWIFTFESGNARVVNELVLNNRVELAAISLLPEWESPRPWLSDLATDGIGLLVNANNPTPGLTQADIREIFAGYRSDWAEFGAQGLGPIQVVVRETGDGAKMLFDQRIMGAVSVTPSAIVMPTPETSINYVALNPGAIAYVPSGRITAAPQPTVKLLSLDNQPVTVETLKTGLYPLHRTINLIARSEPRGPLRAFAAWLFEAEARAIIERLGYAPVN